MNIYHSDDIPDDLKDYFLPAPQLGLEPTPEEYVSHLVDVFREVRRVLRKDGTLWLILGDTYASSWGSRRRSQIGNPCRTERAIKMGDGLKEKDLVGIPWRVAFALRADGWYLRSDIIWSKPNPMPESVTDRPTKAHEYVFLLTKSERYWYDARAVSQRSKHSGRLVRYDGSQKNCLAGDEVNDRRTLIDRSILVGESRNLRTVWTIATEPYPDAHFAIFPSLLVNRCIKAGCPPKGIVLDPFLGSGTTAMVARMLDRDYVGIELNGDYVKMAHRRIASVGRQTSLEV